MSLPGRPTWMMLLVTFLVGCGGGGGSTPMDVAPAVFAYSSPYYAYTAGIAAQKFSPAIKGGVQPFNWSISPALPPGLSFSTADGTISGQPTGAVRASNYVVTAANAGGQTSATLTIASAAAPLIDLGQTTQITLLRFVNSSVLSQASNYGSSDDAYPWVLQDYATGTILARGENGNGVGIPGTYVDLQSVVMADQVAEGLEVRSATTGQKLATIAAPANVSWYRLATDGSYVAAGSPTELNIWSTSGEVLVTLNGDYSGAIPYAAPGQLLLAQGAAGPDVIETVAVASGISTPSPAFKGTFNAWFVDGQGFLTNTGNTVWTYSDAAVQEDLTSVTSVAGLAGQGNWFWTFDGRSSGGSGTLNIYRVGASASPQMSTVFGAGAFANASNGTIGVLGPAAGHVTVVDMSGAALTTSSYTAPYTNSALVTYAAKSALEWVAGDGLGLIIDGASLAGTPRTLTLGAAVSIAGGTSYFAVATDSGSIFYYAASDDSLVGNINFPGSLMAASSDATVLAAASNPATATGQNQNINIYSLPSGALVNNFSYSYPVQLTNDLQLSGSGNLMVEYFGSSSTNPCDTQVVNTLAGATSYCDTTGVISNVLLSPDGTLIAVAPADGVDSNVTNIYQAGKLTGSVPGLPVIWLDNSRLLLNEYSSSSGMALPMTIYDYHGNLLGNAATSGTIGGNYGARRVASGDSIFTGTGLVSYTTGESTWASGNVPGAEGAITNSQVIFQSGSYVLTQPF